MGGHLVIAAIILINTVCDENGVCILLVTLSYFNLPIANIRVQRENQVCFL